LDRTSSNIDALLSGDNRAALKSALADIATVSRTIAARRDVIDAGIVNAARAADNSARATAQLLPVIARIGQAADAVEKMGKDVSVAGASTATTVRAVGGDAHRFAADTLPEIQRLLGELNDLSNSLRQLSEQTARDPSGLLRGRSPVPDGPGETSTEHPSP
jgi:phospholipid/cholesterol/gamma-HCH transport system substrate-binding protein